MVLCEYFHMKLLDQFTNLAEQRYKRGSGHCYSKHGCGAIVVGSRLSLHGRSSISYDTAGGYH
jgi:hypothetical protein